MFQFLPTASCCDTGLMRGTIYYFNVSLVSRYVQDHKSCQRSFQGLTYTYTRIELRIRWLSSEYDAHSYTRNNIIMINCNCTEFLEIAIFCFSFSNFPTCLRKKKRVRKKDKKNNDLLSV